METESPGASLEQGCRPEAGAVRDPNRFCEPHEIWVCCACGKTSELDCYGIEGDHSRGWDESCMLNAGKFKRTQLVYASGRVVEIAEDRTEDSQVGTPSSETLSR